MNDVDTWIDALDANTRNAAIPTVAGITPDVTLAYLVQQNLPRTQLPVFDGSPTKWVNFITKFRDVVHLQQYLNDTQRCLHLVQQLEGQAERAVSGFTHDSRGYVWSLQRLKFLFGQKAKVAQATLRQVTQGPALPRNDDAAVVEFYHTVSDCLITLRMLNYVADLYSTETLRLSVKRLPVNLKRKWAERSVAIRGRGAEPSLLHLEQWLQSTVLVLQEVEIPVSTSSGGKPRDVKKLNVNLVGVNSCLSCGGKHRPRIPFWKCEVYQKAKPGKRFDLVKNLERCINCLKNGHSVDKCESTNTCHVKDCEEKHHTTLHEHFTTSTGDSKDGVTGTTAVVNSVAVGKVTTDVKDCFLQTVPVVLKAGKRSCSTYALLDTCATNTLIRDDLARNLRLTGKLAPVMVGTFKDEPELMNFEEVTFDIDSKDGTNSFAVEAGLVVPADRFHMPEKPRLVRCTDDDFYTHLDGIDLDAIKPNQIGILIGADVAEALLPVDVRCGSRNQPLAVKTKFGWTLFGGASKNSALTINRISVRRISEDEVNNALVSFWSEDKVPTISINTVSVVKDELSEALEKFWKVGQEPIAMKENAMSQEDVEALEKLDNETELVDNTYRVPMLWKDPSVQFPKNLPMVLKRFALLQKRLVGDPEMLQKSMAVIEGYIHKGYARKLSPEEARTIGPRTWYLPIHPVTNPNKPGKVRLVNDAAAQYHGTSLNKSLITGPDLLNSLIGVLLRFRVGPVAISADVEEMFLRIRTTEEDSDSLRFLWKDDFHNNDSPDTYKMLVHIFGAKDSPTVANYALKRTARDNSDKFDALTFETALRSFYVDDCLKSDDSYATAITLVKQLIEMMKLGNFRLTKFISNSKTVLDALPPSEVSPTVSVDIDIEKCARALCLS